MIGFIAAANALHEIAAAEAKRRKQEEREAARNAETKVYPRSEGMDALVLGYLCENGTVSEYITDQCRRAVTATDLDKARAKMRGEK